MQSSCKETPTKVYKQKSPKYANEFCRCCNACLKVKHGDTWKSVSTVDQFKPAIGQDSLAVRLQNIGIVCDRGSLWSERLCRTCAGKIKRTCDGFTFLANNLNASNPECSVSNEEKENLHTKHRVKRCLPTTLSTSERSPRSSKAQRDKVSECVPHSTISPRKCLDYQSRHVESQHDSEGKKQEKDRPNIYERPVEIGDVLGGRQTRVKVLIQWPNGNTEIRIPSIW